MNHRSKKNHCPKKRNSLLSQLLLLLLPILVVVLPVFLLSSLAGKWGGEAEDLSIVFTFGGSFLGTLTFWILFECDFLRSKQMKRIACTINALKENVKDLDKIVRESAKPGSPADATPESPSPPSPAKES